MVDNKYTPTNNNKKVLIDKTKKLEALRYTIEAAQSTAYHPEPVVFMKTQQDVFSSITLIIGADVHSGSLGSNAIREQMMIDFIKNTANCSYIIAGDLFNSVTKAGQNRHEDLFDNQRAIEREIALLTPIKHKIPIVLDGNHDGKNGDRWKETNMSPSKHLADALGVEHSEFGVLLEVELHTNDYRRKYETMSIFVSHCSGKTSGAAKSVDITQEKAMSQLRKAGIMPDIIFGGHFHANADSNVAMEYLVYDREGKCVGSKRKDVYVVSESTLQETAAYSTALGYPPSDSNVYINNLSLVKNPYYNIQSKNTQPEYIVQLIRFPMFKEGTNEYTDTAIKYMESYREPTYLLEKIATEYANMGISEAILGLAEETNDFKSAKFLLENEDFVPTSDKVSDESVNNGSSNDGMED